MDATKLDPGPHRSREIRFARIVTWGPWRLKLYTIGRPGPELLATALDAARVHLPDDGHHGFGHLIVHAAPQYTYVLVCWWAEHNEIHQVILSAPPGRPLALHPTRAIGCVWELAITDFERRAWLDHVLVAPDGPHVDRYLAAEYVDVV
jgi:hypothetical protein